MKQWRGFGAVAVLVGSTLFASCSDEAAKPACTPGESKACGCTDGRQGAQLCREDGKGFAACICEGQPAAGGNGQGGDDPGQAGVPGVEPGGSAGTPPSGEAGTSNVSEGPGAAEGEPCLSDATCESGHCRRVLGQAARVCVESPDACAFVDGNRVEATEGDGPCVSPHALYRCEGGQWLEQLCPDAAATCSAGACRKCEPGKHACGGISSIITCNAEGTGYELTEDCFDGNAFFCAPSSQTCAKTCEQGSYYGCAVDTGHRFQCNDKTLVEVSCPLGQHCTGLGECVAGEPEELLVAEQLSPTTVVSYPQVRAIEDDKVIVSYLRGPYPSGKTEARTVDLATGELGPVVPVTSAAHVTLAALHADEAQSVTLVTSDPAAVELLWLNTDATVAKGPLPIVPQAAFADATLLAPDKVVVTWHGYAAGGRLLGPGAASKDLTVGVLSSDIISSAPLGSGFVVTWDDPAVGRLQCFDADGVPVLAQPLETPRAYAIGGAPGKRAAILWRTEGGFSGQWLTEACALSGSIEETAGVPEEARMWPGGQLAVKARVDETEGSHYAVFAFDEAGSSMGAPVQITGTYPNSYVSLDVLGADSLVVAMPSASAIYVRRFEHPFAN